MRSTSAWFAVLILGGAGFFWWQRSQIVHLKEQVGALEESQKRASEPSPIPTMSAEARIGAPGFQATQARASRLRRLDEDNAVLRADERRLILSQYRDVLAELKLPAATASRLEDLLMERVEVVLDAEDAAVRVGFAEGSAQMAQAVALAIAGVSREIAILVGPEGDRRLNWFSPPPPPQPQPEPALSPEPSVPATVVNVVVQTPMPPAYSETGSQPAVAEASTPYVPYYYYPFTTVFIGRSMARPFARGRPGAIRPFHPAAGLGARLASRRH